MSTIMQEIGMEAFRKREQAQDEAIKDWWKRYKQTHDSPLRKSGVPQVGGKSRLRIKLLYYTPLHFFFMSGFCGSCIYELNKPVASHYELLNDADPRYWNYLVVIRKFPERFEKNRKEGPYTLKSRYVYKLLLKGVLTPEDMIEDAVRFYYLKKLSYGARLKYRGIVPETTFKKENVKKAKSLFQEGEGNYKTNMGKVTRPLTNNDCGILTPLDKSASERLRYVELDCLDFFEQYQSHYETFHGGKGLTREFFIYLDPPFPGTEDYYGDLFPPDKHLELIQLLLQCPFNVMLSIGGECENYLEAFREAGWIVEPVKTCYSTNATHQRQDVEYLIMNYQIKGAKYISEIPEGLPEFPRMEEDQQKPLKTDSLRQETLEGFT